VPNSTNLSSSTSSNSIDNQNKRNLASKMIADELKELIQKEKRTTADLFFQLLKVQEDQQQNQSQQQHQQQQFMDCFDQNILNNSHNQSQTPTFVDHLLMSPIFGQLLPQSNNNNNNSNNNNIQKQDDDNQNNNSRNDPSPTKLPTFFPNLINNNTLNMHRPIPISQTGPIKTTSESIQQSIRNSLHNSPLMFNHFHQNISNSNTVFSYPNISPNISNTNTNASNGTYSPTNNLFPSITSLFQSPLCTPRATPTHAFASYFLNNSDCIDNNNAFHSFLIPTSTLQTQLSNSESNDSSRVYNTFLDTANILNDQQASLPQATQTTTNLTSQQLIHQQSNGLNNQTPSTTLTTNNNNTTSPSSSSNNNTNNSNRENNLVIANN
jgi:hypothetical protein